MPRFFNTAGPCRPEIHYTVDSLPRLTGVQELIDGESYFVLHAPRQTGKTTYLYAMMHHLNAKGTYTALQVNIQPAATGVDPDQSMWILTQCIHSQAKIYLQEAERPDAAHSLSLENFQSIGRLKGYLADWAERCPKPIVLFIDEADSLFDENFLTLLGELRSGFEARPKAFPQSVALIGLRDIRDYKIRIRPESESLGTASPFNIRSESFFMEGFVESEMNALLDQHTEETGQVFISEVRAEFWRLTQGQPWLSNALAHEIVVKILKRDVTQEITLQHVTQAREALIQRRDTHLDSLIDKLRMPSVKMVAQAIINGDSPQFNIFDNAVLYAADLGLVTRKSPIRFANPIYQEIIPRVLSMGFQLGMPNDAVDPVWYIHDGKLNLEALLLAFQKFYRRYSEAWLEKYDFREVGRQLLLMAFLQRIINSGGVVEREMAVGNGRCDLLLDYGPDRFLIELKLHRDQWSKEEVLEQCARYLSRLGMEHGWVLFFEMDSKLPWEERLSREEHNIAGKNITLLGM